MRPPTREASTKCVDVYIASVWDRLRTALQEALAQSMAEACRQKQYYDRKIGAVNLKSGNLVLVMVDAFKGKRKIKDRWEKETWEVVCQLVTDVPSYKVMNQPRRSRVLHGNWLLLVASEIGIPLYMGSHHTWDRCTSPIPCKTTSARGERKWVPQEESGKAVTQQPTSKAFLGWKNGKLWLLQWMSTRASTEDRWRSPNDLPVKLPWGGKMGSCNFCHGCLPEHPLSTEDGWRPQLMWCGCRPWKEHVIR